MYLRHTIRKKDGKVHRYWTLVRSVRVGRRVIQQTVAQLGELDEHGRLHGYKALFEGERACIEVGCTAHARRKFHELYENHRSQIAGEALEYYGALYDVERKAKDLRLDAQARAALRQAEAAPVSEKLHQWLNKRLVEV